MLARGGGRLAAVEDRHGVTVHRVREPEFPKDDLDAFVRWVDAMNDDMRAAGAALGDTLSFDLVHSHDWLVAGAARKLARRFGCPWLVTVHATEHGRHQGWVEQAPAAPHPRRRAADGARGRRRDHLLALHARPRRRGVRDRRAAHHGRAQRRRPRGPPAGRRPAAAAGAVRGAGRAARAAGRAARLREGLPPRARRAPGRDRAPRRRALPRRRLGHRRARPQGAGAQARPRRATATSSAGSTTRCCTRSTRSPTSA